VREIVVEADRHGDASRMARRGGSERAFITALAFAKQRYLRHRRELVDCGNDEIDAFLVRQATYETHERSFCSDF